MFQDNNHRRYSRFGTMEYALLFPNDHPEPLPAVIVDISLGGLQVRTRVPLPDGAQFMMHIGQGGEVPITTAVEIRYCQKVPHCGLYSVGVKFVPGHSEERMRLVKYIHDAFEECGEALTG